MSKTAKEKKSAGKFSNKKNKDTISVELEGTSEGSKDDYNKNNRYEKKDPSAQILFREAVRRNAELKLKMTDSEKRKHSDDSFHFHDSSSRANVRQITQSRKPAHDKKETRSKNPTESTKQLEREQLKHINGLSQMSSDKLPPQPNTRSVLYFQNRFIILDAADRNTGSTNLTINNDKHANDITNVKSRKMESMETSFSKINSSGDTRNKNNRKDIEMDASSVTMDARGIDIILTDPDNSSKQIKNMDSFNIEDSKKRNTIWRKINRVLLDDRVKASNGKIVLENRHPEEYRILKKVLNILFLTIGITLFVSVIIVVIYAFIVGDDKSDTKFLQSSTTTTAAPG